MKSYRGFFLNSRIRIAFALSVAAAISGYLPISYFSDKFNQPLNSSPTIEHSYTSDDRKVIFDVSDEDGIEKLELHGFYNENGITKRGRFEGKVELMEDNRRIISFILPKNVTQGQVSLNITDNKQASERKSFDLTELVK